LEAAKEFGSFIQKDWVYIVDTQRVLFPNPLNLLLLAKIKELPHNPMYYIYAPQLVVRLLSVLTGFIIKPDKVISSQDEFHLVLV
jgi:hypothetical protein